MAASPTMVGAITTLIILVAVFLAGQRDGTEPGANLDPLDGVDRHQRAGQIAIELVIDWLAETGRDT